MTVTDPTRIEIGTDPLTRRMTGTTAHGFIPFDVPVISEIAPGLWQGGCKNGLRLPGHIKHLVSLYPWERYKVKHELASETYVRMRDSEEQAVEQVPLLGAWVNLCRKNGPVLVSCQAGLNRSSLVVASALMLDGMTADAAIAMLRERRSPACLCNPAFEAWLRDRDRDPAPALSLPVAELWPDGPADTIGVRSLNALRRAGFKTAGEVAASRPADLLDIRNFGNTQLAEVRRVLAVAGLSLIGEQSR